MNDARAHLDQLADVDGLLEQDPIDRERGGLAGGVTHGAERGALVHHAHDHAAEDGRMTQPVGLMRHHEVGDHRLGRLRRLGRRVRSTCWWLHARWRWEGVRRRCRSTACTRRSDGRARTPARREAVADLVVVERRFVEGASERAPGRAVDRRSIEPDRCASPAPARSDGPLARGAVAQEQTRGAGAGILPRRRRRIVHAARHRGCHPPIRRGAGSDGASAHHAGSPISDRRQLQQVTRRHLRPRAAQRVGDGRLAVDDGDREAAGIQTVGAKERRRSRARSIRSPPARTESIIAETATRAGAS